jgi:drug/metabolite transporter (DMT)-like permease
VIAVVGWAAYGEPLDPLVFAGAALILTGNLMTLRRSAQPLDPAAP